MALVGWQRLLDGAPWFRDEGSYPIAAYSEYLPPPSVGPKPYGPEGGHGFNEDDPYGWRVSEAEEALELRPGLTTVSKAVVRALFELSQGRPVCGLAQQKLVDNPAWPADLSQAGALPHERYVILLPLALSRTLDDKGRLRWTVFGSSEQGPARAFWRSFFTTPRRQQPAKEGENLVRRVLHDVYDEPEAKLANLRRAGFRILPLGPDLPYPFEGDGPLPDWTQPYLWSADKPLRDIRYLLTFRPFAALPPKVRQAYLQGDLVLLPCPSSLLFWGVQAAVQLQRELPFAFQVPLLHLLKRHEGLHGLRVPQAGWMHEPRPDQAKPPHHPHHAHPDDPQLAVRNTYQRTHRWDKVHRHQNELDVLQKEDKVAHVLFSTHGDDLGLYGKPMGRNVQLWTCDNHLLLDGPHATRTQLYEAAGRVSGGGLFGYRFHFPPMRVGLHEVYWHRPLAAYWDASHNEARLIADAPTGYLTAYLADRPTLGTPIELWPRLLSREPYLEALQLFRQPRDPHPHQTDLNARMLLDSREQAGRPLARSFAGAILTGHCDRAVDHWLKELPGWALDADRGRRLAETIDRCLEPEATGKAGEEPNTAWTYWGTANRPFEVRYWKTIARLAEGRYRNKDNADCVLDPATQSHLAHPHRDLEALGDYLLKYYTREVDKAGMSRKAVVGEIPFHWQTDFQFDWMGGWLLNQEHKTYERDLITVIPGRDRGRAVIMADHYDTAYMVDRYDPQYGGTGARLAAAGADDNHSATTALMLAAPLFLKLSREGALACDVWLVHLTGEEFPSDCLGARHLSQLLVEGRLKVRTTTGRWRDFSQVRIQGVYVLDMVAHNNDRERDVFQIAPGTGRQSLWLAEQAHRANEVWNEAVPIWNQRAARKGLGRGQRSPDGRTIPATAAHLSLCGEVRLPANPRSTLYNTDGQIFSDAGIPVVLFMENYDIDREGYHDTHDNMLNIDLDYGAALTAIAIESVARAATEPPV
jgi:hypothetical protein